MKRRLPAGFVAVASTLLLSGSSSPAGAQELGARELKRAVRQAEKAYGDGRYVQALEFYDRILASTSGTDARRADALYVSAMIRLSSEAGLGDVERGRRHLEELEQFPLHPRRLEIANLSSALSRLDAARSEVEARIAETDARIAAFEAQRAQAQAERQEEAVVESDAVDDRVKSLESRLRKTRSEVASCRSELETKEQALQKLRDALVGGS